MIFVNWDGRPAISISPLEAVAIVRPGGDWISVDAEDVFNTGGVISTEDDFRAKFEGSFGKFSLPNNSTKD